jgi:hypothetical protein
MILKKVLRRSTVLLLVAVAGVATLIVTSATASTQKKTASGDVCVLFPDPATSIRWVNYDAPAMKSSLKAAGVTAQIYNAGGDAQKQKAQADQCLGNGAKVIVEVAIDAGSAAAIEKSAKAKGIPSIDYDRQVKGGVASIYVSFDGRAVGVLQGKGIVNGLKANGKYSQHPVVAEVNGGATDANAFLFKGGYDSVLKPLYANGTFKKGPDDLRSDARQDGQQDRCGSGRERRHGRRRDRLPEEGRAEADSGFGPGRDTAGLPEHHQWLADDDGLEGHARAREGSGEGGRSADQGSEADDHRNGAERLEEGAGVHHRAGCALQVELDEDLHVRIPQEERHLHRDVQAVLQVART